MASDFKIKKTMIQSLQIHNFRGYDNLKIDFDDNYTVLIGLNGSGKSTILDALSIALGAFIGTFDDVKGNSITGKDTRTKTEKIGSRIETQSVFPVEVISTGLVAGKGPVSWKRALNGKGRKTTYAEASGIINIARNYQDRLRQQDQSCILPLMAYYGTGRLWSQTFPRSSSISSKKWSRQQGYVDCLNVAMNQVQMLRWYQDMTLIGLQENEPIPELSAVEKAVSVCYRHAEQSIDDARMYYSVRDKCLVMETRRGEKIEKLPVSSLSDGERGVISLVSDIAYRMAVLNPQLLTEITYTPGIVLIDEIDMHLHPRWQKNIIQDLTNTFPNVQFIVTTHSPSIISNVSSEHVRILSDWQARMPDSQTYGRNLNELLLDLLGIDVRPHQVVELQNDFDKAIDDNNFSKAEEILDRMKEIMDENSREIIDNNITLDVEKADNDID